MKITKVEIKNFRNLKEFNADFADGVNSIKGANHIGKTNVLQAIYWVLADALIDNSAEFDSITPTTDRRAVTSVKLTFDNGHTFEKTYEEKWTRTRGTDTEKLTGHVTKYLQNAVAIPTREEARKAIRIEILGSKMYEAEGYPVDLVKVLTNPLYLFGQEKWQNAREFIIRLVGEVTNEDVFLRHQELEPIRDDLKEADGRTDLLSKKYKQNYASNSDELKKSEMLLAAFKEKAEANDVTDTAIKKADDFLTEYNAKLASLDDDSAENPMIEVYQKQIADIQEKLSDANRQKLAEDQKNFAIYTRLKQKADDEYYAALRKYNEAKGMADGRQSRINLDRSSIASYEKRLADENALLDRLHQAYISKKAETFTPTETKCPNCGYVLNQADIDSEMKAFNLKKDSDLVSIVARGREAKTEVSRLEAELKKAKENLAFESNYSAEEEQKNIEALKKVADDKRDEADRIECPKGTMTETVADLVRQLSDAKNKLAIEKSATNSSRQRKIEEFMAANESDVKTSKEIKTKAIIHADALGSISKEETNKAVISKRLAELDNKKAILKQFIITKMAMVKESTKILFPDVEMVLIENNITEGSYNEVCYPLIKGKSTPFADGSNSERILTGMAIINDIRNYLAMEPVTILFDEGETLDSNSLTQLTGETQLIITQVDQNPKDDNIKVTSNYMNI